MEIERKFYVNYIPQALLSEQCSRISQYYLHTNPDLRIRSVDNSQFYLTYKSETDDPISRREVEFEISSSEFNKLRSRTLTLDDGSEVMIQKIRRGIQLDGYSKVVVDQFLVPAIDGLFIEIEFDDRESAERFNPPDWFGVEITGDKFYYNSNLAKSSQF